MPFFNIYSISFQFAHLHQRPKAIASERLIPPPESPPRICPGAGQRCVARRVMAGAGRCYRHLPLAAQGPPALGHAFCPHYFQNPA